MFDYDLVVIGCGPGGQKAAIAAAKQGTRAAIIEGADVVGGVCINTGTIPSKTLRETVLYLTGLSQREVYGQSYRLKHEITMQDLNARTQHVISREIHTIQDQLGRNHVALLYGRARLLDPHSVLVQGKTSDTTIKAEKAYKVAALDVTNKLRTVRNVRAAEPKPVQRSV